MQPCCPKRLGCNRPARDQACALDVLRAVAGVVPEAAEALSRWQILRGAPSRAWPDNERRFRRRAYERARDRALAVLALTAAEHVPLTAAEHVPLTAAEHVPLTAAEHVPLTAAGEGVTGDGAAYAAVAAAPSRSRR
jgi:hypothetical protein